MKEIRVNVQKLAQLGISYTEFRSMPYGVARDLGLIEETEQAQRPVFSPIVPPGAIGYSINGVYHPLPPPRPRYRGFIIDVSPKRNRS